MSFLFVLTSLVSGVDTETIAPAILFEKMKQHQNRTYSGNMLSTADCFDPAGTPLWHETTESVFQIGASRFKFQNVTRLKEGQRELNLDGNFGAYQGYMATFNYPGNTKDAFLRNGYTTVFSKEEADSTFGYLATKDRNGAVLFGYDYMQADPDLVSRLEKESLENATVHEVTPGSSTVPKAVELRAQLSTGSYRIQFDPDRDYSIVLFELTRKPEDSPERDPKAHLARTLVVKDFEYKQVDGEWFPVGATIESSTAPTPAQRIVTRIQISNPKIEDNLPNDAFHLEYPPESVVFDKNLSLVCRVGVNGSLVPYIESELQDMNLDIVSNFVKDDKPVASPVSAAGTDTSVPLVTDKEIKHKTVGPYIAITAAVPLLALTFWWLLKRRQSASMERAESPNS